MKLHAILLALYVALASSAKLLVREDTCPRDNYWIAVWGSEGDDDIVSAVIDCQNHQTTTFRTNTYSVATITILAHTTETAVVSCSLPGFNWPTPAPIPGGTLGKLKARQSGGVFYSTTAIVGSIPTSAVVGCETSDAIYNNDEYGYHYIHFYSHFYSIL
ncbi:hypothetical protein E8E11_000225 [Didymella keratinophila]|nr:hypothetical protein E8E11_000225 [Didymella keratinophila]